MATTNDISPYLQRPVRKLEEALAEVEQQRLGTPAQAITSKSGDSSPPDDAATNKEAM